MNSWHSYPSIFNFGHRVIKDLLTVDVNVEEKIDGSQFSFGLVEASEVDAVYDVYLKDGILTPFALKIRSKGCVMHIDAPEKMFSLAAQTVKRLAPKLTPGWTYRGEYLAKPRHNALAYERVPESNIIIFDINTGDQEYLSYADKKAEAERLGLETVPLLYSGTIKDVVSFRQFLDTTSVLGGQKVEGVVVKPKDYNLYGPDKKVLMGKFVSEAFKEVHRSNWKNENPTNKDIIQQIGLMYCTPARWQKAIMHLRESGQIEDSPRDIGLIVREVPQDVLKEEAEEIKERLFKYAWPHISRSLTRGLAEWYKDQLLRKAFEVGEGTMDDTSDSGSSVRVDICAANDVKE